LSFYRCFTLPNRFTTITFGFRSFLLGNCHDYLI
jgi:hypothetical protein